MNLLKTIMIYFVIFNLIAIESFAGFDECQKLLSPRYLANGDTVEIKEGKLVLESSDGNVYQKSVEKSRELLALVQGNLYPQMKDVKNIGHALKLHDSLSQLKYSTVKFKKRMEKTSFAQMDNERLNGLKQIEQKFESLLKNIFDNTNNVIMIGGSKKLRRKLLTTLSLISVNNGNKESKSFISKDDESKKMRENLENIFFQSQNSHNFQTPERLDFSELDLNINSINMGKGEIGYRFRVIDTLTPQNIDQNLAGIEVKDTDIAILLVDRDFEYEIRYLAEILKKRKLQIFVIASDKGEEFQAKKILTSLLKRDYDKVVLGSLVHGEAENFQLMDTIFKFADFSGNLKISRVHDDYQTLIKEYQQFILDLTIREKSLEAIHDFCISKIGTNLDSSVTEPFFSERSLKDIIKTAYEIYNKVEGSKARFFRIKRIKDLKQEISEERNDMLFNVKSESQYAYISRNLVEDLRDTESVVDFAKNKSNAIANEILDNQSKDFNKLDISVEEISKKIEENMANYHHEWVKYNIENDGNSLAKNLETDLMDIENQSLDSIKSLVAIFDELVKMDTNRPEVKKAIGLSKQIVANLTITLAITSVVSMSLLVGDISSLTYTQIFEHILNGNLQDGLNMTSGNLALFLSFASALGISVTMGGGYSLALPVILGLYVRHKMHKKLDENLTEKYEEKKQELINDNRDQLQIGLNSLSKKELEVIKKQYKIIEGIIRNKKNLLDSLKSSDVGKLEKMEEQKQEAIKKIVGSWIRN